MRRVLATVLFDQFELLDVFGPLELFGVLRDDFELVMLGPTAAPVASAQGPRVVPDHAYGDAPAADIVLVPGGIGTRPLAGDSDFVSWLTRYADAAGYVTSVCTGSALLAAAGLLNGRRATSTARVSDGVEYEPHRDPLWDPFAAKNGLA